MLNFTAEINVFSVLYKMLVLLLALECFCAILMEMSKDNMASCDLQPVQVQF